MGTNQRDKQKNKLAEYWKAFIDTVGALIWKMNFILEFQGFAIRCQDDGRSAGFHLLFRVIGRLFSEITEIYIIKSFDETNYFAFAIVLFGL